MYQVAAAVRAMGTRDWFDYLSVLAPLVLSAVAIWISISTAVKQNKIALFNLRYEAIHSLALILSYSKMIVGIEKANVAQYLFNANFACEIKYDDKLMALHQTYVELRKVEKSVLVIEYLFSTKDMEEIQELFTLLRNFMERLVENEVNSEWRDKLCAACEAFEKGTYKELSEKTKL